MRPKSLHVNPQYSTLNLVMSKTPRVYVNKIDIATGIAAIEEAARLPLHDGRYRTKTGYSYRYFWGKCNDEIAKQDQEMLRAKLLKRFPQISHIIIGKEITPPFHHNTDRRYRNLRILIKSEKIK